MTQNLLLFGARRNITHIPVTNFNLEKMY